VSDGQAAAVHREPADLTAKVGADRLGKSCRRGRVAGAPLRAFRPQAAAPGLAFIARLVTGVGVIGGFDSGRRDLVDVATVVVDVRVLRSGGRVDGLIALLVALGLVVVGVPGALVGEVRAFLFGERKLGGREDETGFANLLNQGRPGVLDAAARKNAMSAGLRLERGA
jgi:hypothetical protein